MKFDKKYIIIALFIFFIITLMRFSNRDDYKKVFDIVDDKKNYSKLDKIDLSRYTFNADKNELGIPEDQLKYLDSTLNIKTSLETHPIELNKNDAIYDVNFLFNVLEYSYAGYLYFGDYELWNNTKINIINNINLHNEKINSKELEKIIFDNLKFIQDAHFKVNFKSSLKHYNYYYSEEFEIEEDKQGYYLYDNNKKKYIKSINNSYKISDYIKLSINKDGELCKYIGFISEDNFNNIKITLNFENVDNDIYIKLNNNNYYYYDDLKNKEKIGYTYDEVDGIPIFTMNKMYNINSNDNSVQLFSDSANNAKNENIIILDIRGNSGGNDIAPLTWFKNFTGESPRVGKTSIKLASLINNYITKIASQNIDYENLSMELKEEFDYELEIANNKENEWYISTQKENIFKNDTKIFVIIDNKVASSGENFISYLNTLENVIFVGTNTSGALLSNSFIQYDLPHSKINISYGNNLTLTNNFIEGIGFEPDIWLSEKDTLERVLKLIN